MTVRILEGDCRDVLRTLSDESVHCIVTSPPYFGLRDYDIQPQIWGGDEACEHEWSAIVRTGGGKQNSSGKRWQHTSGGVSGHGAASTNTCASCGAWKGCLGLEPTPDLFVEHMVAVFRECHRVLREDGTLWLNIGDSYATNGGPGWQGKTGQRSDRRFTGTRNTVAMREQARTAYAGHKPKDLIGVPWMLAFALRADGWFLRQDIIWAKPNPMPESVTDRCTKAHEYLFLLSKSSRYFYDGVAISEEAIYGNEAVYADDTPGLHSGESHEGSGKTTRRFAKGVAGWGTGRNSAVEHNVTGRETHAQLVKAENRTVEVGAIVKRNKRSVWNVPTAPFKEAHFATFPPKLIEPCVLAGSPRGGVVLDPFGGAGTTGLVADRLQRDAILIELNPGYAAMARRRIEGDSPLFTGRAVTA